MTTPHDGGPAYPIQEPAGQWSKHLGMSLRDYFAGQALASILYEADDFWPGAVSLAYQYSDAMLAERQKFYVQKKT